MGWWLRNFQGEKTSKWAKKPKKQHILLYFFHIRGVGGCFRSKYDIFCTLPLVLLLLTQAMNGYFVYLWNKVINEHVDKNLMIWIEYVERSSSIFVHRIAAGTKLKKIKKAKLGCEIVGCR